MENKTDALVGPPRPFPSGIDYYGYGHHMGCGSQPDTGNVQFIQNECNLFMIIHYQTVLGLVVDGCFGTKTEAGVRLVQEKLRVSVDGEVGPITWKGMQS